MQYETIIGESRINELQNSLGASIWPEFMQHDDTVNYHWPNLYSNFLKYQYALLENHEIIGVGNTVPLNWQNPFSELPDSGLDWAMEKSNDDYMHRVTPNLLIGIQILINKEYQRHGISYDMLNVMKDIAKANKIGNIALPVRPTMKKDYPLIPMDDYMSWENADGLPFDSWLRVHIKAGGKIVGNCNKSMEITGSISEWEKWTGMKFPGSGNYIIDKALVPIDIDKNNDIGKYVEPNVWVVHRVQ